MNKQIQNLETLVVLPIKEWFTLQEACALKGINIKTAYNNRDLMPNNGKYEGRIGGRYCFTYRTIKNWIAMSDEEIRGGNKI